MSHAMDNLQAALQRAMAGRPQVGGFPYLAETLRRAGVQCNHWFLPVCQSLQLTAAGPVVSQGTPLLSGTADVPKFNRDALIAALRTDQAGRSTFRSSCWLAGKPGWCARKLISLPAPAHISGVQTRVTSKTAAQ